MYIGETNREAADDPPQHEVGDTNRQAGANARDQEEHRGNQHHAAATKPLSELATNEGANGRAKQRDRDDKALDEAIRDVEFRKDGLVSTVDDRAVVAEEEATERCDDREGYDLADVVLVRLRVGLR